MTWTTTRVANVGYSPSAMNPTATAAGITARVTATPNQRMIRAVRYTSNKIVSELTTQSIRARNAVRSPRSVIASYTRSDWAK